MSKTTVGLAMQFRTTSYDDAGGDLCAAAVPVVGVDVGFARSLIWRCRPHHRCDWEVSG